MTFVLLPVLSLIYISIFLLLYFFKKRMIIFENKVVIVMMIVNAIGLLLELGCYAVLCWLKIQDSFLGMFIMKSYIAYIAVFNWLLTGYVFLVTNENYGKPGYDLRKYFYKILLYFLPVTLFLVVACYIAPLYYNNTFGKYYTYGFAADCLALVTSIETPIWFIKCFLSIRKSVDKEFRKRIYLILASITLVSIAALLTQTIDKSVLIITTSETLILAIVYLTIDNPDVRLIHQLEAAKDSAEKASRAKSDFLSSMSHEIRTPLNAIVGLSQDMINHKEEIKPEMIEDAEIIFESSQKLLDIVGNILNINNLDNNDLTITEVNYNLKEEAEKIYNISKYRIGDKDIDFRLNVSPDIPYELLGDKDHIIEIINNLLSNAIKYTEKGYVDLNIDCINQKYITNLIISVKDTGIGIKEENLDRVFDKFERLDVEINSDIEGTGLGLSITKSLVEMMNGSITVQSTLGEGSNFVVKIPQKISKLKDESKDIDIL